MIYFRIGSSSTVNIYGLNDDGTPNYDDRKSLVRLVQAGDGPNWHAFIRGERQTEGGVYTTAPIDSSNSHLQALTIPVVHQASAWANGLIDSIAQGRLPTCL